MALKRDSRLFAERFVPSLLTLLIAPAAYAAPPSLPSISDVGVGGNVANWVEANSCPVGVSSCSTLVTGVGFAQSRIDVAADESYIFQIVGEGIAGTSGFMDSAIIKLGNDNAGVLARNEIEETGDVTSSDFTSLYISTDIETGDLLRAIDNSIGANIDNRVGMAVHLHNYNGQGTTSRADDVEIMNNTFDFTQTVGTVGNPWWSFTGVLAADYDIEGHVNFGENEGGQVFRNSVLRGEAIAPNTVMNFDLGNGTGQNHTFDGQQDAGDMVFTTSIATQVKNAPGSDYGDVSQYEDVFLLEFAPLGPPIADIEGKRHANVGAADNGINFVNTDLDLEFEEVQPWAWPDALGTTPTLTLE